MGDGLNGVDRVAICSLLCVVFYFTSLMNLAWNNMPIRGLLVPLMYRLLILGGTDEVNTSPVVVGETKWIILNL